MKKIFITCLSLFSGICFLQAQTPHVCGTDQVNREFFEKNPEKKISADLMNAEFETYNIQNEGGPKAPKIIPLVFHVVHTYGSENISDAQILDAVRIMNEDFQKLNADTSSIVQAFKSIIGNTQFKFRMARLDPNGNCTNGIVRVFSPSHLLGNENTKAIAPAWPRDKYVNVWVVSKLENGAGGYTFLPSTASFQPANDGIILLHTQFGSIGTSNGSTLARRTLPHEMGHFFNLNHTWGGSNTPGVSCGNDNVNDTPTTEGVGDFSCNTAQVTCNSLDNVQNIMDYASCPTMFTVGQSTRMNNCATSNTFSFRKNLWQAANLVTTGTNDGFTDTLCAPLADFNASKRTTCVGNPYTIQDFSWRGTPTAWNWTFTSGSNVVTASGQTPTVTFDQPGIYNVTLSVSNAQGTDSHTENNYIKVYPAQAELNDGNYSDDFENAPLTSGRWFVANQDNNGWAWNNSAAVSGTRSMRIRNSSQLFGTISQLFSPSYDFTQVAQPKLKFKYAFAQQATDNTDALRVFISTNCGDSWNLIPPLYQGANLSTVTGVNTGTFVPNASQWVEATVNISPGYYNKPNVRFRFDFNSGNGNDLYLDDINITGTVGLNDEVKSEYNVQLYPNPATENVTLSLDAYTPASMQIQVLDMLGKTVYTSNNYTVSGAQKYQIPVSGLAAGVYTVRIRIGSYLMSEKLMVGN